MRTKASVLVGLLWCVALLSLVVVGVLHSVTLELRVTKNYGDRIQAHYLAVAGIEKAKAVLYHEAKERRASHVNHSRNVYDSPHDFRDVALGRGNFRVFRQGTREDNETVVFGVTDEESRLNVNYASAEELAKLPEMTPETVAAIIDYRDKDNSVTQGGAEAEQYATLQPPYLPRNALFRTLRELSMVLGMSQKLLVAEDANRNGLLDAEERDGNSSSPPDNRDGFLDQGWTGLITVDSSVRNVNAAGNDRVNVQQADEAALSAVPGITSEIAKAIVQSRGQNKLENLADLLEVRGQNPNAPPQPSPPPGNPSGGSRGRRNPGPAAAGENPSSSQPGPSGSSNAQGPKVINETLLMEIADDITTSESADQPGAVNINSAPAEVLACLPGMTRELAQAVVAHRKSAGFFANIAGLFKVPDMTPQIFKQLAPRVTARSETFRILSEGRVTSSGARQRLQLTVRLRNYYIDTLSYREDDL